MCPGGVAADIFRAAIGMHVVVGCCLPDALQSCRKDRRDPLAGIVALCQPSRIIFAAQGAFFLPRVLAGGIDAPSK